MGSFELNREVMIFPFSSLSGNSNPTIGSVNSYLICFPSILGLSNLCQSEDYSAVSYISENNYRNAMIGDC